MRVVSDNFLGRACDRFEVSNDPRLIFDDEAVTTTCGVTRTFAKRCKAKWTEASVRVPNLRAARTPPNDVSSHHREHNKHRDKNRSDAAKQDEEQMWLIWKCKDVEKKAADDEECCHGSGHDERHVRTNRLHSRDVPIPLSLRNRPRGESRIARWLCVVKQCARRRFCG